ncbi:MgtC/SapB transporter [Halobacteriales archaeon QS_5_70_15]|nr:MAG: MgtC/SapB transporter [Halobacteriales archaeon QS_5_70_15]
MLGALDGGVARLAVAAALGLFLGLEREWSEKAAGVRTLSLVALLGAAFVSLDAPWLLAVGALAVAALGTALALRGLLDGDEGLSLTTATTMLVAYGAGALVGTGRLLEGVTVAVVSSLLLVLRRELHGLADALTREEVRSASEFAVLAFVAYPLLPADPRTISLAGQPVTVEPRVVWAMVVFVAGIGVVNYTLVRLYGGRGIAVTGFLGGLASSTAVVGSTLDHVSGRPAAADYGLAAVLLANAAMALRNLAIAVGFTLSAAPLVGAVAPLGAVVVGSVLVAWWSADWSERVDLDLTSPFTLRYALGFGGLFLAVVVAGGLAQATLGAAGLVATAAVAGLVSSAGATTSAVLLYRAGSLTPETAVLAVLVATLSSIAVKAGLTLAAGERSFGLRVAGWSAAVAALAGVVAVALVLA